MQHALMVPSALVVLLAACSEPTTPTEVGGPSAAVLAPNATANRPGTTVIVYDNFQKPGGYTLADYNAKWSTLTLGEMAVQDTRQFDNHTFSISATPFRTGKDSSVLDHAKYTALSKQAFAVPEIGSVTGSIDIAAETPGTIIGHVVHGTYVQSGAPYAARVLQGQQAAATFHMIDFATGQLFDWFVSGNTAFTLYERLPSSVSGSAEHVGIDKMFTQIIDEVPIAAGVPHTVAIRYSRERHGTLVEYFLDGKRVSKVERVGIPLDAQGVKYSGIYPSLGPGELLRDKINSVTIAHGLFSLLDAFPFQHPEAPALNVSVPMQERLFGQGARARFAHVVVTIEDKTNRADR
ncbi:MAG TPA: DUF6081 family protein [Gemmatimonadales bacterium]|nr:DUF6081 family protein [Gemmatimonadales bacterium]